MFGGALDVETASRLVRPSGTATFVDKDGNEVRLYRPQRVQTVLLLHLLGLLVFSIFACYVAANHGKTAAQLDNVRDTCTCGAAEKFAPRD